jgi:N12 class adenine-specific DNA methylase
MSIIDERRKKLQELKERKNYASTNTTSSTAANGGSSSRRDQLNALKAERVKSVASTLSSRIETWLNNHNNYVNNYNSRYSSRKGTFEDSYVPDSGEWLDTITAQKSNFDKEAQNIMSLLDAYGDYLGSDYTNSVKNALQSAMGQQSEFLKQASSDKDFWSQFADENEYLGYQSEYKKQQRYEGYQNKYAGKSYEDIIAAMNTLMGDEEKEWLNSNKYNLLSTAEDFADKSKAGYAAYEADIQSAAEREEAAKRDEKWYEKIGRYLGDVGPDTTLPTAGITQATYDIRNDTSYMKPSNSWSQEQKDIYGYLYATDKGAAAEYAHYANELNNQASNEEKITAVENWATKNGLTGTLATLGSIALQPMSLVDSLGAIIEQNERGFVSTSATPLPGQVSGAIRSAISETLNQKYGTLNEEKHVIGGKGWGDVYQLATSIADSMISAYTQGSVGTFMVFFGSASASGIYEAKERGATDEQAVTLGILNGLAEAAGEAFSVDKLLGLAGVDELKSFFGNVLMQAGIEASEEGFTTLLNNFADQLVMGDKSNFNVLVNYYMSEKKLSEEEAKRKAWADMAYDLAYDMLSGAISGGVSAGIHTGIQNGVQGIQNIVQGKEYKETFGADIGTALAGEGVEISPNSSFAQKMQKKVEGGKELSNRQVGKLVQQNESAMYKNDAAAIKSAAANRLTELGESGNVDIIATALAKQVTGESLTLPEKKAIKSSEYAQRVANELNPENIRSGGYSSAWAEKIGTDRINAAEYGRMIAELEHDATDSKFSPKTNVIRPPEEPEEEGATVSETENVQQVTGKLPASKTDFETDTNVGGKTAQESTVASEGLTEVREEKGATYETSEVKDAQTGEIEASEGNHIADADKMVSEAEEESGTTLEAASAKYGAQAGAMVHTFVEGQDVAKYDAAYRVAYDMGKSGVNLSYAMQSESTAYLTEKQRELAYEAGTAASKTAAEAQDAQNRAAINGKSGRKRGTVRGEGVSISDLKASFNDTQGTAYKLLSTYAEATGVDIVLYKSEANADGKFEGAQGRFKWSEDTIYIDINAGLADIKSVNDLAKYTMMRTFSHEFSHFIEKWNPIWYNELRKVVFDTITANGENVDKLIAVKMEQAGLDYEKASREVVAEALTDILPDANFVEELATKHKNLFEQLLAKLKEFLADLKAYFSSIGPNSSREANALKEQVGDSVKYVESVVKLFDKVAAEAVENYQMTVATDIETNNTDGGITNVTERAEEGKSAETVHAGRDSDTQGEQRETREENGGRSRVPEEVRGAREEKREVHEVLQRTSRKRIDDSWLTDAANHIAPAKGSELQKAQQAFAEEYGVECYIIKAEAWKRKNLATTHNGKVYVSESIDADTLLTLVPHEGTHTMKQRGFQPYMDFVEGTPDNLLMQADETRKLFEEVSEHRIIDIFDMTEEERTNLYDELNSFVYGLYKSGIIDNADFDYGWVKDAFNDFDAYVNELSAIHEQFKKENAPKQAAAPEVDTRSLEEREKEYKKKYSSWLKRAIKQYVMHYGDTTFLSNGALGLKASEDMIGFARTEFAGMVYETDVPDAAKTALDNANTLMTEAPLEGALKDNTPVYVFNVDGKQRVFDKKHLSKLDGNLLYIGDFTREAKIIKAVDADGNVVGFLLPMKLSYEVTNTKPSKLKSFSSKFQSQIKQEVTPNVENVDNRGTVQQPQPDRQGDSQLLEESQTEDVPRDVPRGDSLGDAGERGQQTARDDNRADAAGTRGRSGEGDRESGDLRRDDDGLSADKLHEEVVQQIAEQSTEQPKGRNFVIGESLDLPNGEKARYKANVEAIRLVKQLEAEGRYATEAEQIVLSKYVGWGGLANAFDQRKSEWAKEYTELKEILSDDEYTSARGSTLNAHFTDISVIKAMYDGLAGLGFNGGRLLEPSSGVGNFVGAMPTEMSAKVKSWTMVELDSITGLIAKYLYPNADVRIQGFEKANIPDNYMDVAISNVPFGDYAITDKAYPKNITRAIHNYFFAKSLDKVRPGGIVMFITSSYTMNSKDSAVRRYIMQRADLLGAIRLPDSAFKGNAGTEVVTDILVLKKRAEHTAYGGEDFLEAPYKSIEGYNGAYINSYFDAHPEMVLGTATMSGGMYRGGSLTYKALEGKGSLGDQIREAFKSIKGKMEYPATQSREKTNFAVERANKKTKENGLVVKDGKVYQNKGGELIEKNTAKGAAERVEGMLEIRDAARELLTYQQQGLNDSEIKKARTKLNKVYDAFVKKYGFINSQTNKSAFKEDPDCYSLFALENWDPDTKKATKADIFSKNTIAPNRTVTSAKDVAEGLIVSVNQTGGVDTALIARLTGKTEADVTRELIDGRKAFKNRNGALEAAEVYLSGNVRAKLRDAEALVPIDADYKHNVEALKSVIPADVGYQDIFVNAGTPWIPNSVYSDFAAYMLGTRNTEWRQDVDVTRNPETGNFTVELKSRYLKTNSANTQKWGTARRSFLDLFDAMLNSKSVVIKDKLDDGSFVINKDATAAANEKIENIQKEFQEWLWKDEGRRTELATLYNETFNSIVTPKYNGDNLTVNGANAMKPLRPHQRDAVQRVISSGGNTLLAHKVGAGKTYEMAAAAMKLRELGLVKKPLFAVPKSLVAQWGNEFKDFFPTSKLLVAEASDFTAANRKVFMNRIANGEYDAVIVSYEQFEKLPMSDDFTRELYQEQIDSVVAAIEEAKAEKGDKALSIKDLEKKRKSLQAKIDKLTDKAKDEDNIDFEQLGVDSLFVDEAHNFKNLFYTTSMTNVSGLGNKDGSKRAFDLYTKVRYLQQLNGGRGIVFATATPVMNSMSEMYIMQKYLQPDLINQLGLSTFDAWAKQFGEVVNGVEIKPSGQGYRVKQSFSRFKNMSELQLLFRNFADVLTDIPGLKIPKMKGGKVNVVVCEPGQFQQDYMKELEKRADNIKNVDPSEDNMLKITSDGRKISYTQRMIDPSLPYEEGCKIYRCADNVIAAYNESKDIKGTQLIFCDMATPKGKSNNETATEDLETDNDSAQLYDDLKARLRSLGIPAKEIAFIHEADTDAKKKKLFADVNEGKVRVLIGSTGKMGVGMNAQKRVVAIHHLDAPWRPGDVEQRNGRAFRQGNINDEVECFTYVTEGSFDARLWDILERKQNFINQIMNGESVGREAEDTGEVTLSAAEVKALASGSPLIMEQVQLDTDIKKLESLYRAHMSAVRSAKERLLRDSGAISNFEKYIEAGKVDLSARVDTYSEGKFSIKVGKTTYTDKKEAGTALMAAATANATPTAYTTIGSFAGFDVRVIKTHEGIKGLLSGKQGYSFNTYPERTTYMITHLSAVAESIEEKIKLWEHSLTETQADMAEQEKLIAAPFGKQSELDTKRARYNEVMEILNPKEEQSLDSVADDTVQEQSREYLEEQEQQRTDTLTDREVLQMAAEKLAGDNLDEGEKAALEIFNKRLYTLETLQEERTEQGRLYKEQQFGAKVDRAAAAETLERMHILDGKIKAANASILEVENKEVLGRVLKKARKVVETEQRAHDDEIFKRYVDRTKNAAAIKKYRERIKTDVSDLTNWVLSPNNKDITKHVPDVIKNSVIPFLKSIDFTSKQQLRGGDATKADTEFVKRLAGLEAALKENIEAEGLYSGYTDLPPYFMERLNDFIKNVQTLTEQKSGEFVINKMTSEELKELAGVVKVLKAYITQMNSFHNNAMFAHVWEAGDDSIAALSGMASNNGTANGISNFVFWQQMRPAYAFERFGEGGKAIYDGLRRGQAQLAFNTQKIVDFTEKAYTDREVKAWEKEIKSIRISAGTVKMRVSDIMSFYELAKQPDSLRHMLGEGMRVATYTADGKKISDNGHALNEGDIAIITGTLTERQKAVADAMQKFMQEQGGAWGNYVSVARFGEELFTNEQYFPINSDGRHLQSTADEYPSNASLYALLNMSFTKSRNEKANNRIVVYSIFDVFANHMASMAQYNAMALPVLDAIKWFNYQQKTEDADGNRYVKDGVREQMDRVYGVPEETRPGKGRGGYAQSFVLNIIKAFNGTEAQGVPTDTFGMNALRRYNMAQIAYNFRVVVQQPLAITRAALMIDYGSIMKGLQLSPAAINKNIAEMREHSGIAAWKSLGFYDINISRGLTDTIKHNTTLMQNIGEVGMKGAEWADTVTWAAMWNACKEEVIKKQRLRPSDAGFYDAVTKLFEDVVYKTQVVDSVLTKNEFMRSKGMFARAIGSFMSEPATTASMVLDTVDKYNADLKRGMNKSQAWEKNKRMIGRTMYVYAVSATLLAAVQAIADAWRDDDDYETFLEKWLEAFGGNIVDELMPFNKLPILSDFYDLAKELLAIFGVDTYGNPPQSVFMQWYDSLVKGTEIIYDKIAGEDTNYTWYGGIYKLLQALSGMTGAPMAATTREIVAIWNNIVGAMAPSLKIKSYDPGEANEIKYAYADGYLTFDEAINELIEQGLVDNEDEAYFTVSGWEAGEGYSRYDAIYDAVLNGGDFDAAMEELTSHGYDEEDVIGRVASQIGSWYSDSESDIRISKQQAISMLEKYTDMTDEEITKKINRWSSKVVTGIAYEDIGDEFLEGNITASRASEMFVRYGSMTKDEAGKKVAVLQFVKDYPQFDANDVSYSMVEGFLTYGESAGIDVNIFYDAWKYKTNAKADLDKNGKAISGSAKEKVLDYVDALDLTKKQKDSLYYAFGYAESELKKSPWR